MQAVLGCNESQTPEERENAKTGSRTVHYLLYVLASLTDLYAAAAQVRLRSIVVRELHEHTIKLRFVLSQEFLTDRISLETAMQFLDEARSIIYNLFDYN